MLSSPLWSGRPSRIWRTRFPMEAWPSSCSAWPRSDDRRSWSKATTQTSFELSPAGDPGWPTCLAASLCGIPRFRSCSPDRGGSLRNGLSDSLEQPSLTASDLHSRRLSQEFSRSSQWNPADVLSEPHTRVIGLEHGVAGFDFLGFHHRMVKSHPYAGGTTGGGLRVARWRVSGPRAERSRHLAPD